MSTLLVLKVHININLTLKELSKPSTLSVLTEFTAYPTTQGEIRRKDYWSYITCSLVWVYVQLCKFVCFYFEHFPVSFFLQWLRNCVLQHAHEAMNTWFPGVKPYSAIGMQCTVRERSGHNVWSTRNSLDECLTKRVKGNETDTAASPGQHSPNRKNSTEVPRSSFLGANSCLVIKKCENWNKQTKKSRTEIIFYF